ncbi:MFS transporter [Parvibaculum sp.]|uniref:MFS transporter n=1 Tax=Parvibaculum sp. TaxID=2024848 RepID=UPI002C5E54C0|nr:MFS transporter [Parvibaculum sp.]HUD52464.1 MFS transporter [Parvibaculum sp.]
MDSAANVRLNKGELFAFSFLVVPMAVIGLPLAIYIPPFYSGTLGLDLAAVGIVMMLARLADVVIDPFIGRWSDRTRTRWGRRRPWVIAGVVVMMISSIMLFMPQISISNLYLFAWISAIYIGYTLIEIPYGAWGAEISGDYHERNRITGSRQMFSLIGLLVAITVPIVASQSGDHGTAASRTSMAALGIITAVMLPICATVLFRFVPEPSFHHTEPIAFRQGLRIALRNGPFRLILFTVMLGAIAGSVNAGVAILFLEKVAGLASSQSSLLIFVLFLAAVVGSPVWVRVGGRIGKHRGVVLAGIVSLCAFALVPAVIYWLKPIAPEWVFPALLAIIVVQGLTSSASPILGASMLADVVDLDTLKSGEQRTAFLFAFLAMVRKIFEAAGVGIALPILSWSGFNASGSVNTPFALFMLTAMYCLVPLALWVGCVFIVAQYPITHERQQRLRGALERRLARRAASRLAVEPRVMPAD